MLMASSKVPQFTPQIALLSDPEFAARRPFLAEKNAGSRTLDGEHAL